MWSSTVMMVAEVAPAHLSLRPQLYIEVTGFVLIFLFFFSEYVSLLLVVSYLHQTSLLVSVVPCMCLNVVAV